MPEPYLDYPIWNSEDDDARQDVLRHIIGLADECVNMAALVANIFDRRAEDWSPDDLENVEKFHHELISLCSYLHTFDL